MGYQYHYGVPGAVIWTVHIAMGLYFIWLGYQLNKGEQVAPLNGLILLVLGVLAFLYHLHLLFTGGRTSSQTVGKPSLCPAAAFRK